MKRCVAIGKRTRDGWIIRLPHSTLLVRPEGLPKQGYNAALE